MKVPFLDLKAQSGSIHDELLCEITQVIDKTAFAGGSFVQAFEEEFARYCGSRYAIGLGSGTEALWAALIACGVGSGDEVITVPNTFIATAEAISFCGARPVFVDIDESTYTMNPLRFEAAITEKTKAVIPVHIFGQPADMAPITAIAKSHGLAVVEDACQAHGAEYNGKRAGAIGDVGCFSFYPGKNLGAFGEAGAVVTDVPAIAEKIRRFRDHGQSKKYYHDMVGWNGRMDGIQGAVLRVKLQYLEQWTNRRRDNASLYDELLSNAPGVILPREASYARHVYHLYAVRVRSRDALIAALAEHDISCGIHYPVPLHVTAAYAGLGYAQGDFPVSEKCADEFLSLPMYPELTREQIHYVVDTMVSCMNGAQ